MTVTEEEGNSIFKAVSKIKLELKPICFVILNGFFDEVVMSNYESLQTINPYGCDVLNIRMDEEYKGLKWLKF